VVTALAEVWFRLLAEVWVLLLSEVWPLLLSGVRLLLFISPSVDRSKIKLYLSTTSRVNWGQDTC